MARRCCAGTASRSRGACCSSARRRRTRQGILKAQVLDGGRGKRGLVRRGRGRRGAGGGGGDPRRRSAMRRRRCCWKKRCRWRGRSTWRCASTAPRSAIELLCAPEGGVEVEAGRAPCCAGRMEPEAPGALEDAYAVLRAGLPGRPRGAAGPAGGAAGAGDAGRGPGPAGDQPARRCWPNGRLVACDAKLVRDDSAALPPRGPGLSAALEDAALTPLERRARDQGFQLVELQGGTVAMITAGAGLGMLMLDLLADAGCPAACFMDNANGGPAETMPERLAARLRDGRAAGGEGGDVLHHPGLARAEGPGRGAGRGAARQSAARSPSSPASPPAMRRCAAIPWPRRGDAGRGRRRRAARRPACAGAGGLAAVRGTRLQSGRGA